MPTPVYPIWWDPFLVGKNGELLPGGKVYAYYAGTGLTVQAPTYNDNDQPNAFPVVADTDARIQMKLDPQITYDLAIYSASNVLVRTRLNVALGSFGSQGATGSDGVQGITGPRGITGFMGLTGHMGITGVRGITGANGITGSKGPAGNTGAQGLPGVLGVTGGNMQMAYFGPDNQVWGATGIVTTDGVSMRFGASTGTRTTLESGGLTTITDNADSTSLITPSSVTTIDAVQTRDATLSPSSLALRDQEVTTVMLDGVASTMNSYLTGRKLLAGATGILLESTNGYLRAGSFSSSDGEFALKLGFTGANTAGDYILLSDSYLYGPGPILEMSNGVKTSQLSASSLSFQGGSSSFTEGTSLYIADGTHTVELTTTDLQFDGVSIFTEGAHRYEVYKTTGTVWTIDHNLGVYPIVQVLNTSLQVINATIVHNTVNQCTVTVSGAQAVRVICIG